MEQRTSSDSVDGITFAVLSAPGILLGAVVNLLWIAKAIVDAWRRHTLEAFLWLVDAWAVWATAVLVGRWLL